MLQKNTRIGRPPKKIGKDDPDLFFDLLIDALNEIRDRGEKVTERKLAQAIDWQLLGYHGKVTDRRPVLRRYFHDFESFLVKQIVTLLLTDDARKRYYDVIWKTPAIDWMRTKTKSQCIDLARQFDREHPDPRLMVAFSMYELYESKQLISYVRELDPLDFLINDANSN